MTHEQPDVAVIGAGIVGLATALKLSESGAQVTVVDKEGAVAAHQTGHNSGVLHTGIYYQPGSFKARLCVVGRRKMLDFCHEAGIPTRISGKVVVAVRTAELPALEELHRRATANGVEGVRRISSDELKDLEPEAAGIAALHVPSAGVVDFKRVAKAMRRKIEARGGVILTASRVTGGKRQNGKWSLEIEGTSVLATVPR